MSISLLLDKVDFDREIGCAMLEGVDMTVSGKSLNRLVGEVRKDSVDRKYY